MLCRRAALWLFPLALAACSSGTAPTNSSPPSATPAPAPSAAAAPAPMPSPAAPSATRSFADFRPSLHGFAFHNDFPGSPLPFGLGSTDDHFGLCGGMSSAAADFFLAGRAVPAAASPPAHGTPLYDYLYQRQASSVGPAGAMGFKFIQWMQLPDDGPGGTRDLTAQELAIIYAAIQRHEPVVLGLVLTSANGKQHAWDNHQVLAIGWRGPDPASHDAADILIYDPNFPRRDDTIIRIAPGPNGLPRLTRQVPGRRDLPIRGLFRVPYIPAVPPAAL